MRQTSVSHCLFIAAACLISQPQKAYSQAPALQIPKCPQAQIDRDCCPPDPSRIGTHDGLEHFLPPRGPTEKIYAFSILEPPSSDKRTKHVIRHSVCNYGSNPINFWWRAWQRAPAKVFAEQCWCTTAIRPSGEHDQIRTNIQGYLKLSYSNQEFDAYYFDLAEHTAKANNRGDTIKQSVGVLFDKGGKTNLERIEFSSHWSGNSIDTRISAKTDRFIIALEFSPRDLERLRRPSPTDQMHATIDAVTPFIKEKEVQDWLGDELSGVKFLILDPKRREFDYQIFSADAASAVEQRISAMFLSRDGEVLATTPVTLFLPE